MALQSHQKRAIGIQNGAIVSDDNHDEMRQITNEYIKKVPPLVQRRDELQRQLLDLSMDRVTHKKEKKIRKKEIQTELESIKKQLLIYAKMWGN